VGPRHLNRRIPVSRSIEVLGGLVGVRGDAEVPKKMPQSVKEWPKCRARSGEPVKEKTVFICETTIAIRFQRANLAQRYLTSDRGWGRSITTDSRMVDECRCRHTITWQRKWGFEGTERTSVAANLGSNDGTKQKRQKGEKGTKGQEADRGEEESLSLTTG